MLRNSISRWSRLRNDKTNRGRYGHIPLRTFPKPYLIFPNPVRVQPPRFLLDRYQAQNRRNPPSNRIRHSDKVAIKTAQSNQPLNKQFQSGPSTRWIGRILRPGKNPTLCYPRPRPIQRLRACSMPIQVQRPTQLFQPHKAALRKSRVMRKWDHLRTNQQHLPQTELGYYPRSVHN